MLPRNIRYPKARRRYKRDGRVTETAGSSFLRQRKTLKAMRKSL